MSSRATQRSRLLVQDMQATINEGITGRLERYAASRDDSPDPSRVAGGVMVLAQRVVPSVRAACNDWGLAVIVRDGQPGCQVLTVNGPELAVQALCDTICALRAFGVCMP
ncbi:MAG: hypothetical protein ACLP01_04845 [Solirubrobacteraceae bacterium]